MHMHPEIVWSTKSPDQHLQKLAGELKEKVDPMLAAHLSKLRSAWRHPVARQKRRSKKLSSKAA